MFTMPRLKNGFKYLPQACERSPADKCPLVVWVTGQPAASSLITAFKVHQSASQPTLLETFSGKL
jgi:hypothetical protein